MDTLIKYAIYAALVVAALATVTLAWHRFVIAPAEARGAAEQAAKDAPIIAGLTKQRDQAIAANASLSASIDELKHQVDLAHQAWLAANAAAAVQHQAALKAIAVAKASTAAALDQVRKLAALAATPTDEAQAAQCAEAEAILADYATWRRSLH